MSGSPTTTYGAVALRRRDQTYPATENTSSLIKCPGAVGCPGDRSDRKARDHTTCVGPNSVPPVTMMCGVPASDAPLVSLRSDVNTGETPPRCFCGSSITQTALDHLA